MSRIRMLLGSAVDLVIDVVAERIMLRLDSALEGDDGEGLGLGLDADDGDDPDADLDALNDEIDADLDAEVAAMHETEVSGMRETSLGGFSVDPPGTPMRADQRINWRPLRVGSDEGAPSGVGVMQLKIPAFAKQSETSKVVLSGASWAHSKVTRLRALVHMHPALAQAIVQMPDIELGTSRTRRMLMSVTDVAVNGEPKPERFVVQQIRPAVQVAELRSERTANLLPSGWNVLTNGAEIGLLGELIMTGSHENLSLEVSVPGFIPDEILAAVPEECRVVVVSLSVGFSVLQDAAFGSSEPLPAN